MIFSHENRNSSPLPAGCTFRLHIPFFVIKSLVRSVWLSRVFWAYSVGCSVDGSLPVGDGPCISKRHILMIVQPRIRVTRPIAVARHAYLPPWTRREDDVLEPLLRNDFEELERDALGAFELELQHLDLDLRADRPDSLCARPR